MTEPLRLIEIARSTYADKVDHLIEDCLSRTSVRRAGSENPTSVCKQLINRGDELHRTYRVEEVAYLIPALDEFEKRPIR